MGQKLHKKIEINEKAKSFKEYFFKNISQEVINFIKILQNDCDLFLFSGIIRDFFLKNHNYFRDIDLVYYSKNTELDIDIILKNGNYSYKKNSFGGYKVNIKNIDIDVWNIQNTWGIMQFESRPFQEFIYEMIPKTSFFNFSSILFSFNNNEFIYTEHFKKFVKNNVIDIVLENNPNPILCIINIIYYQNKLNLKVSERTKQFYIENFNNFSSFDYKEVQIKHFGKILFSYGTLQKYFSKYYEDRKVIIL